MSLNTHKASNEAISCFSPLRKTWVKIKFNLEVVFYFTAFRNLPAVDKFKGLNCCLLWCEPLNPTKMKDSRISCDLTAKMFVCMWFCPLFFLSIYSIALLDMYIFLDEGKWRRHMVASVDVSVPVCKCVHVCLFCALGDIEPTHYRRECSCSQLTPLSSLFTGASEGGSECRPGKRSVMLTQKWAYDRAPSKQMSARLSEKKKEASRESGCSAAEMLEKPERGRGGTTVSRWEWQSKGKKCWACWETEKASRICLSVYFHSSCVGGKRRE